MFIACRGNFVLIFYFSFLWVSCTNNEESFPVNENTPINATPFPKAYSQVPIFDSTSACNTELTFDMLYANEDLLEYSIHLDKDTFQLGEEIIFKYKACNPTDDPVCVWLNQRMHPVGKELVLVDSLGHKMFEFYSVIYHSTLYLMEDVKKMVSNIKPSDCYKSDFILSEVLVLKERPLPRGNYLLTYGETDTFRISIR